MRKTIVVTGASKGIGRAIVLLFAKNNWNVCFCSRGKENVEALEIEVKRVNENIEVFAEICDVANKSAIDSFCQKVNERFGSVDVLVNNAGIFLPGSLHEGDDDIFDQVMKTNVYSAYYITKWFVGNMKLLKKGYIFNMSSIAGLMAYPNGGVYNVSKHALTGFSKTLRDELKEYGIRVTSIFPGATYTASWEGANLPEERLMPAEDIAKTILDCYQLSGRTVVEEIVLRPQLGDI